MGNTADDRLTERMARRHRPDRAHGYESEMCGECGNFTLMRNGTCLKCDTCGASSGCADDPRPEESETRQQNG